MPAHAADRDEGARRAALDRLDRFVAMDREEILAWQRGQLGRALVHAASNSPFYRRRLGGAGDLERTDGERLAGLPFTTKEDLRAAYPFDLLAVPREELCRYGESTGTTGPPTSSFFTLEDWMAGNVWVERALRPHFGPGDLVFVSIPYELTFASYDLDRALERLGATVVPVGALNDVCPFERTARMLQTLHPAGLVCTPTRALRYFDLIRGQGGDPAEVGLRTLLYVGETCAPARLEKIARLWGIRLLSAYGATETNSLALPCPLGRLHLAEDRYWFELIDPASGEAMADGARGELVLTGLVGRAMPLVRYRTGDLVRIAAEPCPCGERRRVVEHHGRVEDCYRVGERTVFRLDLEEVVLATPGSGLYWVAAARDGALRVWLEAAGDDPAASCRAAARRIEETFGVPAVVRPVERDAIAPVLDQILKPGMLRAEQVASLFERDADAHA
jgi:phenylacetate-CoA ligase